MENTNNNPNTLVKENPPTFQWLPTLVLLLVALVAVFTIPWIDKVLLDSPEPGLLTFAGTGAAIAIITAALFTFGLNPRLRPAKAFLIYLALSLIIVALVKFDIAPHLFFISAIGDPIQYMSSSDDVSFYPFLLAFSSATVTFFLYFIVLLGLHKAFKVRELEDGQQKNKSLTKQIMKILAGVLVLVTVLYYGWMLLLFLLLSPAQPALEYLFRVFASPGGIVITAVLLAAFVCAINAFHNLRIEVVNTRSAALASGGFLVAVSVLAVFHILWVVFLLVLTSYWPLKVETFTSK